jgi:hypothetical protein
MVSNELVKVLSPLGMQVNSAKTKWLAFLPERVSNEITHYTPRLQFQGTFLENVESFRYQGFDTEWNLSKKQHQLRREELQSLAAKCMGRLMRRLEVTNFKSLRSYYMTLVRSQLYSLTFSVFSENEYNRAQQLFLQHAFSLPPSFPIHLSCFLLDIPNFILSVFDARTKFMARLARFGSLASLSALVLDREELFPFGIGWNRELTTTFDHLVDSSEVDFLGPEEVVDLRSKLLAAVMSNKTRILHASSFFLLEFFPEGKMPSEFSIFLGHLPFEAVRILLVFFADLFPCTYLRSTNKSCPFCSGQLSLSHLFSCPQTPPPYNDWQALVSKFLGEDYWGAVDWIFLTLQRWAAISNKFSPGFEVKLEEYFRDTEAVATGRNKSGSFR